MDMTHAHHLISLDIGNIVGDLSVSGTDDENSHRVRGVTGRATFENNVLHLGNTIGDCALVVPDTTHVHLSNVAGDTNLQNLGNLDLGSVSGDLNVREVNRLHLKTVGGDCSLHTIASSVKAKSIGGDFDAHHLEGGLVLKSIGGDASCHHIDGEVEIRSIGGDVHCHHLEGKLDVRAIGGDVHCHAIDDGINVRAVGGDVHLVEIDGSCVVEKIGGDLDLKLEYQPENTYTFSAKGVVTFHVDDDTDAIFNLPAGVPVKFEEFDAQPNVASNQLTLGSGSATVTIIPDEEHGTKKIVFKRG